MNTFKNKLFHLAKLFVILLFDTVRLLSKRDFVYSVSKIPPKVWKEEKPGKSKMFKLPQSTWRPENVAETH